MEAKASPVEERLDAIDRKLELIVSRMEEADRHQRAMRELKDDLGRIATEMFGAATTELQDVAPHFETQDLLHLAKKLLRNTRNLSKTLDRLESLSDFLEDAAPLQKAAFLNLLATLDELDRKGYFAFLRELQGVLDNIVTSFSPEDVRLLGENVVAILSTVRGFTQPEILNAMDNALKVYQHIGDRVEEDVSYRRLFREARSPEVRRGVLLAMKFLKDVSDPVHRARKQDE